MWERRRASLKEKQTEELIVRASRGEQAAIDRLLSSDLLRKFVSARARQLMRNEQEAEDVTQDVLHGFLAFLRNRTATSEPIRELESYLRTMITNRIIREKQRLTDKHAVSLEEWMEEIPDDRPFRDSPEKLAEYHDLRRKIIECLMKKKEGHLDVDILQHRVDGRSHAEIAEILSMTSENVRKRFSTQIRRCVTSALEDAGYSFRDQK